MSVRLQVVASAPDAELAGLAGEQPWGRAETAAAAAGADVVVALGDAALPDGDGAAIEWSESSLARLRGRDGDAPWRRLPWPAAEAAFELPPNPSGGVLVSGPGAAEVVGALERRGRLAALAERPGLDDLRAAAAVVLWDEAGSPLPARAPAVLAARRVLIAPSGEPAFGLQSGIHYLAADSVEQAAEYADVAVTYPKAFASLRAWARVAALPYRASALYARLVTDLVSDGSLA